MHQQPLTRNEKLALGIMLCAGLGLRLWALDFQSLWVDELFTAHQTDPADSWPKLIHALQIDVHPPLFFILVKLFTQFLGTGTYILRLPSALLGSFGIYAMFLLGREVINKQAGLIAALLTTVNYYSLYYSQEARSYTLTFMLSALSLLYLVRLLRTLSLKNSIYFGLCSLAVLYCHYYDVFFLFAEALITLVFFFDTPAQNRLLYCRRFLTSVAIAVIGFLPWLKYLTAMKDVNMTWVEPVKDSFIIDFFYEYFGKSNLLMPFLLIMLMTFVFRAVVVSNRKGIRLASQPVLLCCIITCITIFGTYAIPYLRSVYVYPALFGRYTMAVLPAYLLALSTGAASIINRPAKIFILSAFALLSVTDLLFVKNYYNKPTKAQFRELADYLVEHNSDNYPVLEETTAWHHDFYLQQMHKSPHWMKNNKRATVDSILRLVHTGKEVAAFWIATVDPDKYLDAAVRKSMDTAYLQAAEKKLTGARTDLFFLNRDIPGVQYIRYNNFIVDHNGQIIDNAQVAGIWTGTRIPAMPIYLTKGNYEVLLSARGTEAGDTFARVKLFANGNSIGVFQTSEYLDIYRTSLTVPQDGNVVFEVSIANDFADTAHDKDRNGFVRLIRIRKL